MGVQEGMKVYLDMKYQLWPSFPMALVGGYIIVSHNTDLYPTAKYLTTVGTDGLLDVATIAPRHIRVTLWYGSTTALESCIERIKFGHVLGSAVRSLPLLS